MADTDQLVYLTNEAVLALRRTAHRLREGANADIVADQADEDAAMLMFALGEARSHNPDSA